MRRLFLLFGALFLPVCLLAQDNSTARRPFGQHTQSFSATPVFDAGITDSWKMTLTANVTSSTLIGAEAGHTYTFEICQDGTGGRTFSWPGNVTGPIAILSGANVCTVEIFPFDGTNAVNPTTATGGGGGSGTVNAGTAGHLTWYAGAGTTVSSNANLDDGITVANAMTYAGSAGIFAPSFNADSSGAAILNGTEGSCGIGASGHDFLCVGDSLPHAIKSSLNGGQFLTLPQYSNDSPTPYAPLCADTVFPHVITVPIGSVGQALLSTGTSSCFAYAALDVSNASNVTGRIQKANIITSAAFNDQTNTGTAAFTLDMSAATAAGAFRLPNIAGASTTTNGVVVYNTTTNNFVGGMNSGNSVLPVTTVTPTNSNCVKWVITSGNFQLGDAGSACGGAGGSSRLDQILAATTTNTIDSANFSQTWRWQLTSASGVAFKIAETAASTSTGTPYLFQVSSTVGSTANPVRFDFNGNGVTVNTAGLLAKLGTGGVDAPSLLGLLPCASHPTLTGDVTASSGACVTVLANIPTATTMAGSLLATAITAPGTPAAGKGSIYIDSTSKNLSVKDDAGVIKHGIQTNTGTSHQYATAVSDAGVVTTAQPIWTDLAAGTGTNATIDAEGTGNVLTRPFYWEFTPACNNATADQGSFDVPTSAATTFSCSGTTTTLGNADFVDASTTGLTTHGTLPDGWVGNVDVTVEWWANAASANAVRWSVATGCVASGAAVNTGPSYNTASATNAAYTGTANQLQVTTQTSVAVTNCAAGRVMWLQVQRIGGDAGDTLTATAELIALKVKGRATQ